MIQHHYYVVWRGRNPGIYISWPEVRRQIEGYPFALFKKFSTLYLAELASISHPKQFLPNSIIERSNAFWGDDFIYIDPITPSFVVDAHYNSAENYMEYCGINLVTRENLFHYGPLEGGNSHIAEFLALVNGIQYMYENGFMTMPLYSKSKLAIRQIQSIQPILVVHANTLTETSLQQIHWANHWRCHHAVPEGILIWLSCLWGQIPKAFKRY